MGRWAKEAAIRPYAFTLLIALVFTLPPVVQVAAVQAAAAQGLDESPTRITADSVEYESEREIYIARGNVRIVQPEKDRTLTADWASFSDVTGRGIATGNVVLVEGRDTLYAELLSFEVDTLRGVVFDGRLDAQGSDFRMSGREIRKTGDNTYTFEDGSFTTCRCPDDGTDPWRIKADRADLEMGGYGTARNTTFEVLGVPVLWMPWMLYPLATDRKSGILFPEFGTGSRSGFSVGLPLFWAAAENVNVTLTPRYTTDRGFFPRFEAEWLVGERSGGEVLASGLNDQQWNDNDPNYPFQQGRWGVDVINEQFLPWDVRTVVDGRAFSDSQYAFDFSEFSDYESNRWVESVAFADRRLGPDGRAAGFVALGWSQDFQNPSNQSRDRFTLQRLPQVNASLAANPLAFIHPSLVGSFDADYTYFAARSDVDDVYDAPVLDRQFQDNGVDSIPNDYERDSQGNIQFDADNDFGEDNGVFDEGEPLADRGSRLLLNPRLSLPLRLFDLIEFTPEVGWLGAAYDTDKQGTELRSLVTGQVTLGTQLRNSVALPFGLGQATHVLSPSLSWTGVSRQSQRNNPLLVPGTAIPQERLRQLDLFNVTRDTADRIESASAFTLGFGNRFYVAGSEGEPAHLLADFVLSGQYDFANQDSRNIFLDGRLYASKDFVARGNFGYDLDKNRVGETLLTFAYAHDAGHDLGIRYRYRREIPPYFEEFNTANDRFNNANSFDRINQASLLTRIALTQRWAITYGGSFSFRDSLALTNRGGVEYVSRCSCWAVRVEVVDQRQRGFEVNLRYTLLGLGADKVRPFDNRRVVSLAGGGS